MKNDAQRQVLHCYPGGPCGGGGRERLPIDAVIRPIHGRTTVVSLPHACLAAGLLEDVRNGGKVNWPTLCGLVQRKWKGDAKLFLADAARAGCTCESSGAKVAHLAGAIIGWAGATADGRTPGARYAFDVVPELDTAVGILSRCVGNLFVAARDPDYSWDRLFGAAFEFDDDAVPAADFAGEPWARFEWALGGEVKRETRRPRASTPERPSRGMGHAK